MKARSIALSPTHIQKDGHTRTRNSNYRTLEELTFEDLYIEIPEQEFPYIKAASQHGLVWLRDKGGDLAMSALIFIKNTDRHHPRPVH